MPACIVSHTHWDRAWYLPFQLFRIRLVELIDEVLETLETDPRFPAFLLDGQTILIVDYLEVRPDAGPRIRALVNAGRLQIGPWYVLADEFLVSGEALIRNLLLGARSAAQFGGAMRVGYVPDSFGHLHTLPQILNGFGLDSFVFMRGMPAAEFARLGREFVWEGPAGSSVLTLYLRDGYFNADRIGFEQLAPAASRAAHNSRAPAGLLMNGMDHTPIQSGLPDLLGAHARRAGETIRHVALPEYIDDLRRISDSLPRYAGELRGNAHHPILAGVHSARIYLKQTNQRVQELLETHAEPLCAALGTEGAGFAAHLDIAWRHLLRTHPHDDVCGCSVDAVHEDDAYQLRQAEQIARGVASAAADRLARSSELTARSGESLLLVHNGHGERACGRVSARVFLPVDADHLALYDVDGAVVPVEVRTIERGIVEPRFRENPEGTAFEIEFIADVPAAGYVFYRAAPAPSAALPGWHRPDAGVALGGWRAVADGEGIRLRPPGGHFDLPLIIEDDADDGDTYSFSPGVHNDTRRIAVKDWSAASTPVASHLHVDLELSAPGSCSAAEPVTMPVQIQLSAAHGSDALRIVAVFQNNVRDHRLRLLIPIGTPATRSWASVPFGVIERDHTEPELPGEAGELPYPTSFSEDFVMVRDAERSVLVAHRALHEYEIVERDGSGYIAVTLVRAVGVLSRTGGKIRSVQAGPEIPVPGAQCPGSHRCALELRVTATALSLAAAARLAAAFARPAMVLAALPDSERQAPKHPARRSIVRITPEDVAITSMRVRADGRLVLRVWNRATERTEAVIELLIPFEALDRCRLDETGPVPLMPDGATLRAELDAGELMTLCYTLVP